MKIYVYENILDELINKFLIKYEKIFLKNEEIVKIMKIFYNNNKLKLSNENLMKDIFKNYSISEKTDILLIKVENYNKVIEFKYILSKYHQVFLLNENNHFINSNIVSKHFELKSKNMILSERIENISEKEDIFKQILDIDIDNIYCITYKDSENKKRIISQVNKINTTIEFVNLSNIEQYKNNLLEGYKYCIQDSRRKNYENVIILLEDNEFNYDNFYRHLKIKSPLNDFDIIFLSGKLFDGYIHDKKYLKVKTIQDNCSLIINKRCYEYIINNIDGKWENLDIWNNKTQIERQINWGKRTFDNFLTKYVCQKRNNSYFLNPLLSFKSDTIDKENRIINYQGVMERLCLVNSRKYYKNFDIFCISNEKRQENIKLLEENPIFLNFNIFQKLDSDFDFIKEDKLKMFNLYPLKENVESHNYDKNIMSNFLNHFYLWEYFSQINDNNLHLILYDDIKLVPDFNYKLNDYLKKLPEDLDMLLLNGSEFKKLDNTYKDFFHRCYLITSNGCKKIINEIKNVQEDVDKTLIKIFNVINVYQTNNLYNYEYKKNKENLFDELNKVNKMLNPNMIETPIEPFDNIKNDKISNHEEFSPLVKDINYKEVIINDMVLFKNSNNILFRIQDNMLEYFGYIKNNKIEINSLHKSLFGLQLERKINRETVIFYNTTEEIYYHMRKIYEFHSLKYNVIVFGKNYYNLKLNNITYINDINEILLQVIELYNVKKIYTTSNLILKSIKKTNDIKLNFIFNSYNNYEMIDNKLLKNNGIDFMKNSYDLYDNILFFNKDKMNELKDTLNLQNLPNNFKLTSYILDKNNINNKLGVKQNLIISIDKHPKKVINSFKLINKKLLNNFKLVLLNNNINKIDDEDIIVEQYNERKFIDYLNKSYFFLTFENKDDTYFNILNSINHYCIPIFSNVFSDLSNKFIGFNNFINKHTLNDISEIYNNKKKTVIYNNICDTIIKNHLNNMNYIF